MTHGAAGVPGQARDGASTTTTGGDIQFAPSTLNTAITFVAGSGGGSGGPVTVLDPRAGAGASVMIRGAGNVILGTVTNPAGDLDIKANADISSLSGKGDLAARDIALQSGGAIGVGTLTALDDIVVRGAGAFAAGAISSGQPVLDQVPGDPTTANPGEAGERLVTRTYATSLGSHAFDLTGHDVDIQAGTVGQPAAITATGAGSDARIVGGTISLGNVTADRDILVDAGGNVAITVSKPI